MENTKWLYRGQDYETQFMAYCLMAAKKKLSGEENWNRVTIMDFLGMAKKDETEISEEKMNEIKSVATDIYQEGFDSFLKTCKEGERRAQAEWPVGRNY